MSVIGTLNVDRARVQKLWDGRRADFEAVQKEAIAAGAIRHRWADAADVGARQDL